MWLDLTQLRSMLDKRNDTDDGLLLDYAAAACDVITEAVGDVELTAHVDTVIIGWYGGKFLLPHRPVAMITAVESLRDDGTVHATLDASLFSGQLLTLGAGTWRISYVSGRDPIPARYNTAGYELAAHMYRIGQLHGGNGKAKLGENDIILPGMTHAIPTRIAELLGLSTTLGRTRTWIA